MAESARFDLDYYGEWVAIAFAKAFCHRMNYLYGLWLEQADEKYVYPEADVSKWAPPAQYIKACETLDSKKNKRIFEVLHQVPIAKLVRGLARKGAVWLKLQAGSMCE